MKNVSIKITGSGTFVVVADTKRFGNHQIMFESFHREECEEYIIKTAAAIIHYSENERDRKDAYALLLHYLPCKKKRQLVGACNRNLYFTSAFTLEWTDVECFDKGIYITFKGVQTSVTMWISNEGKIGRKPIEKSLIRESRCSFHNCESDFNFLFSSNA